MPEAFCQHQTPEVLYHDPQPVEALNHSEDNTFLHTVGFPSGTPGDIDSRSSDVPETLIHPHVEEHEVINSSAPKVDSTTPICTVTRSDADYTSTEKNQHLTTDTTLNSESMEILHLIEMPDIVRPPPQRVFFELFSGPCSPLTTAVLHFGISCLQPMDILQDPEMDILNNSCYEQLLRLASSRIVGTLSAAPPCKEYSLLKLLPGGPPPCRSPQQMDSPLIDEPACIDRFFSSREILLRTIHILKVNFYHGGVSALEQPASAMSWNEDFVQEACDHFLTNSAEFSHCQFLEVHEQPLQKIWRFATSISNFQTASSPCTCGVVHQSFRGKKQRDGSFLSATTAEYPRLLVQHLCKFIIMEDMHVLNPSIIHWAAALNGLPLHPPMRYSHIPDGASLVSSALWPIPYIDDILKPLRDSLHELIFSHRLDLKLRHHILQKTNASPFDESVKARNLQIFSDFLTRLGLTADMSIPADQPFRLSAFKQLTTIIEDPDSDFIDQLHDGVTLGVDQVIPPSGTWPLKQAGVPQEPSPLEICDTNWSSATDQDDILSQLLQDEMDQGFISELFSEEHARSLFGDKFAVGKLAIVSNQPNKHRLVLDSTVCGLNSRSANNIQEHITYPRIQDLMQCIGASVSQQSTLFNIDVKAAHKRIKVRESDRGLLCFRALGRLFCYRVLHFGGSCSAYYWARVASLLLRMCHRLLYLYHSGFVFVGDFLFNFNTPTAALQACTVLLLFDFLNVPISWSKLQLNHAVTWIGWELNTTTCLVSIPQDKLQKLRNMLSKLRSPGKFLRRDIEKLAGNLLWLSDIVTPLRWILGRVYAILARSGIQLVRLQKEQIDFILTNSSSHGILQSMLQTPYVPQGSIIQRLGKFQLDRYTSWSEFAKAASSIQFAWASFINCRSNRVQLHESDAELFSDIFHTFSLCTPAAPLCTPSRTKILAGADAFASQSHFGIGGWIQFPNKCFWFSIQGQESQLPVAFHTGSLQSHILTLETIAQVAFLILIYEKQIRGISLNIVTCLDNQAAEGIMAAGFTQLTVASKVVQAYHHLSQKSGAVLNPVRTSSKDNTRADDLSRGTLFHEDPADRFSLDLFMWIHRWFND